MTQASGPTAVYSGTFDPMTLGHGDIVGRAARLFARLIVAVAAGHHKRTLFDLDQRIAMARDVVACHGNVEVMPFDGLLTDFVVAQGGTAIVRGLRGVRDFDYEFEMAGMNRHLAPGVDTLFLAPSPHVQFISSTLVREIAALGGDVSRLVPPAVHERLMERVRPAPGAA